MTRSPVHQPPAAAVVDQLMRAGVTRSTAMAMESWKAREVLELLRDAGRGEMTLRSYGPLRGSI